MICDFVEERGAKIRLEIDWAFLLLGFFKFWSESAGQSLLHESANRVLAKDMASPKRPCESSTDKALPWSTHGYVLACSLVFGQRIQRACR
mmetsp:Transcript_86922/g.150028  ORF Transcript_86922/g.150028 Transcript_86922/m.150028 type:complete len:91 (+) Transcript_86922:420-692(+)